MLKSGPITGWKPGARVWVKTATPIGRIYDKLEGFKAVLLRLERVQDGLEVWLIESESFTNWTTCCTIHSQMDID